MRNLAARILLMLLGGFAGQALLPMEAQCASAYYVDAVSGNDHNEGRLPSEAWRTLHRAATNRLEAGDHVLLRRGQVWTSGVTNAFVGKPGKPIVWGAYGDGEDPLIDISAMSNSANCIRITPNVQWVHFENLRLKGNGGGTAFYVDANAGSSGFSITASNVIVLANHGAGSGAHDGFALMGAAQLEAWNCSAYKCRPEVPNEFSHQGWTAHHRSKIRVHGGVVDDCNYWYAGTQSAEAWFDGVLFTRNHYVGFELFDGGTGTTQTVVVSNCFVIHTNLESRLFNLWSPSLPASDYTLVFTDSTIIMDAGKHLVGGQLRTENCFLRSNGGDVHLRNSLGNISVQGSYLDLQSRTNALLVNAAGTLAIRHSVINAGGSTSFWWTDDSNAVFTQNLITNFSTSSAVLRIDIGSSRGLVVNNTFWNASKSGTPIAGSGEESIVEVKNNIFANCEAANWSKTVRFAYNCYYNSSDPEDCRPVKGDPRFLAPDQGDFRLRADSPCINAGQNTLTQDTLDLGLQPRISGGTVDIGAYEFQTPASVISHAWLQQYGLSTDGSADNADLDGDGHNSYQEWRSLTDPTNSSSNLRFLCASSEQADFKLTWQSTLGVRYSLEACDDPTASNAFSVVEEGLLGRPGTTSYTHTNAGFLPKLFYRIRVAEALAD